jgi:Holliday junction resolvase RusA-like endonuclease
MPTETLTLRIPRELKSPNAWLWKHWRIKQRERAAWETDIAVSLLTERAKRNVFALLLAQNAVPAAARVCTVKRRVVVTRVVTTKRRFIRDEDNLRFAVKPVNDALKRLGLIKDDNVKWLEQPMPTQIVGPATETIIELADAN